jgi:hypothetical protein
MDFARARTPRAGGRLFRSAALGVALASAGMMAGARCAAATTTAGSEVKSEIPPAVATALAKPLLTPAQQQLRVSLEKKLTPAQLARLQPSVARVRAVLSGRKQGDSQALASQGVRAAFPNLSAMDVDALVYIVMAEAANDADSDLQTTMNQMQAMTAAKQRIRSQLSATDTATASSDAVKQQASLNSKLDSMNDMSTTMQMQLQMAMQQRNQVEQTLSNMMKSLEDSQNSIIQNLKN